MSRPKRHLALVGDAPDPGTVPDLASYDVIAVSSSAGKDSQAALDYVVRLADAAGVRDRVVVIHADLGRVEWGGTGALAREQAEAYGVPFVLTSRIGGIARVSGAVYEKGETFGDLLDYIERRGAWPSSAARYCTSEFKRGPILRVFTQLAREWRLAVPRSRPCRILDVQGLRAEESPARAKKAQLVERKRTRTQAVDTWLPIHRWTTAQVWERIARSGVRHHPAYDLGMGRLSCAFCIFAPKAALMIAGRHNRALLDEYVRIERATGHTFRQGFTIESVRDALDRGERADTDSADDGAWNM